MIYLINDNNYKKDHNLKEILFNFIELYLSKNLSIEYIDFYNYFTQKNNNMRKFNLDEEILLIELRSKVLNG